jgi:FAD/FMN-containing dehydrogenase
MPNPSIRFVAGQVYAPTLGRMATPSIPASPNSYSVYDPTNVGPRNNPHDDDDDFGALGVPLTDTPASPLVNAINWGSRRAQDILQFLAEFNHIYLAGEAWFGRDTRNRCVPPAQRAVDAACVVLPVAKKAEILPEAARLLEESRYLAPSRYRKALRGKVWTAALKVGRGLVRDPHTEEELAEKSWEMGHRYGYGLRKLKTTAREQGWSRKEFLDAFNDPEVYEPQGVASNRSRRFEAPDDINYWVDYLERKGLR